MPGNESTITLEVYRTPCTGIINTPMQLGTVIQLVGASLRNIGEINYEIADGTGEIKTFTATFAYHFYRDFTPFNLGQVFNSF
jgi:hypothetical protein